eukprot:2792025-Pyramimonas_sp.AAC.1
MPCATWRLRRRAWRLQRTPPPCTTVPPYDCTTVPQVVGDLAFASESVATAMYTASLVSTLLQLANKPAQPTLQCAALLALGNLAFTPANRRRLLAHENLRELLVRVVVIITTSLQHHYVIIA